MTIVETLFYMGLYAYVSLGFGYFLNKYISKMRYNIRENEL
jgi:hypothetical protein